MKRIKSTFSAYKDGQIIARLELGLINGKSVLPIIVNCLQSRYTINDYGLFFEGYNREMELNNV